MARTVNLQFLIVKKGKLLLPLFEIELYTEWFMNILSQFLIKHSFMMSGRAEKEKDFKKQSSELNFLQRNTTMDMFGVQILKSFLILLIKMFY